MSVTYEPLVGGEALAKGFGEISHRAMDMWPAFDAIVKDFHSIEATRFESNGPGWLPLAESTKSATGSWARSNQNFDQILNDTGAMLASFTGGASSYTLYTPLSVEMGSTVPYAHWHQTGGTRLHASGAGWPPQRQIVDIHPEDAGIWANIAERWIFEGVVL